MPAYLTGPVDVGVVRGLLPCHWVPVLLTVNFGVLFGVHNCRKGRCNDHPLHRRCVGFDGIQNTRGSLDGGIQEILHGVLNVEVERRCRVKHIVKQWAGLDGLC